MLFILPTRRTTAFPIRTFMSCVQSALWTNTASGAINSGGKRRQKVEIIFNFVDEVEIPALAEPMIAESTLGRRKTA